MSEQTIKQNQEDELVTKQSTTSLLSSLRLPNTYSVSGGTALPLKAIYGKLNKHRFCRIHSGDEYKFRCLVVDDKDRGETDRTESATQAKRFLGYSSATSTQ